MEKKEEVPFSLGFFASPASRVFVPPHFLYLRVRDTWRRIIGKLCHTLTFSRVKALDE